MSIQFHHRILSMLTALVMLFTMSPVQVIAEEEHDHSHEEAIVVLSGKDAAVVEAEALEVSASASANHVYVGDGAVNVAVKISGGAAPYAVTLQAVKGGSVMAADSVTTEDASAGLSFVPESWGDYELVVHVRDALNTQELVSLSLAVAEHEEETEQEWTASVSGASVSADWAKSLVSVARTQLGYAESEKDFVLKNGVKQGYSRYGAWFGVPYGNWNTAFLAFAAEYANIPADVFLAGSSYRSWVNGMSAKGAYEQADSGYTPKAGDVAFLSGSRVAIVESVSGSNVTVIEGDVDGVVARKTYALSKLAGLGNTQLLMGLHQGSATPVPTKVPDVTATPAGDDAAATATPAPTAEPTATPEPVKEDLTFIATPTPRPGATTAPKENGSALSNAVAEVNAAVEQQKAQATSIPTQFTEAYDLMKAELRAFAAKYLSENASAADIRVFVDGLLLQELYYIITEIEELGDYAKSVGLSEYEGAALNESESACKLMIAVEDRWSALTEERADGNYTPVDGVTVAVSDASYTQESSGVITVQATGSSGFLGIGASAATATITVTNSSDTDAVVSFSWTASSVNQLVINGTTETGTSGNFSELIAAGASVNITITTGKNSTTNTFKMSGFSYAVVAEAADVTLDFDSTYGTVTADGTAVADGEIFTVPSEGTTFVATPASGATFVAWVDGSDHRILSTEASYTLLPSADMTLQAVFSGANSPAYFNVDNTYLFENLNDANAAGTMIVLANDGTLPAGDYNISSGKTLLIPFDAAGTVYTTVPGCVNSYTTPSVYRKMTMASGANIVVNGAISVGGTQSAAGATTGHPTGALGFISMQSGSTITVNDGGALYVWGYITGSGSVTANSGAVVYEDFQLTDWRGGSATSGMLNNDQRVFPMSQYHVQNIEVPITLMAGAYEYGYMSVYVTLLGIKGSDVPFIGPSGTLFQNTSGYVRKDYIEGTGRLKLEISGDGSISSLTVAMTGVGTITSQNYVLPINSTITIDVLGGSNISLSQDLALQPGSQFYVRDNATITLSEGNCIFVYDLDDMSKDYVFRNAGYPYVKLRYAPGGVGVTGRAADALIQIDGTIEASSAYAYTTTGMGNIYSSGTGKVNVMVGGQTTTYQATQEDTTISYADIPITPARLKNADGTFTAIEAPGLHIFDDEGIPDDLTYAANDVVTYEYSSTLGRWVVPCGDEHIYYIKSETAATCTAVGQTIYACVCGTAEDVALTSQAALGHSMFAATCTAPATCTVCGATEGTALGHTEVIMEAVAATCTTTGMTEGKKCSVCGLVTVAQTTVAATGHTWSEWEQTVAPGCETTGTEKRTCSACSESDEETIAALGHDYESVVTAPTCTAEGYTTHTCSVCGKSYTDSTVAAKGHTEVTVEAVAATCTATGLTEGKKCSVCGTVTEAQMTVAALGHNYDDAEWQVTAAPGCTTAGTQSRYCTNGCGTAETSTIEAVGHSWGDWQVTTEAGCITAGAQTRTCSVCDAEEIGTIAAVGHQYTQEEITTAATCTTDGVKTLTCANCAEGTEGHTKTAVIPATGHSYASKVTAPTCTVDGYTTHTCQTCGSSYVSDTVTAAGHSYAETVTPPTCTAAGYTTYVCSACAHTYTGNEVAASGHSYSEEVTEPTCTAAGYTTHTCTACGNSYTDTAIAALGHSWGEWATTQEPTCTAAGSQTRTCERCGEAETAAIAATGHTVVEDEAVAPDCTNTGLTAGSHCSVCGTVLVSQTELAALGHAETTADDAVAATCTTSGWTASTYCAYCNETLTERTEIAALGHDYGEWVTVTEVSCKTEGSRKQTCIRCGDVKTETIEKLAHTERVLAAMEATCTNTGLTAGVDCSVCGEVLTAQTETEALGHDYGEWVVTAATCVADGQQVRTCSRACGEEGATQTEVITSTGHQYGEWVTDKEATCTEEGSRTKTCTVCAEGTEGHTVSEVIAKIDHTYVKETTQPTCTADGYITTTCAECDYNAVTYPDELKSAGHQFGETKTTAPTCTEDGKVEYYCSVCTEVYLTYTAEDEGYEQLKATGHTMVTDAAVAATCTASGLTEGQHCTNCDDATVAQTVVPALGHAVVTDAAVAPTCTETGLTEGKHCSVCNEVLTAQTVVDALGHTEVTDAAVAATCTATGLTEGSHCSVCNEVLTAQTVVDALGHNIVVDEAKAATCTESGLTAGQHCTRCDAETVAQDVVPALNHPDVTEYQQVNPTCQQTGTDYGKYCNTCMTWLDEQVVLETVDHSYNEAAGVFTPATCEDNAYSTYTCFWCTATKVVEVENSAINHANAEDTAAVEATCTTVGYTAGKWCPDCETYIEGHEEIASGHVYGDWGVTEATCTTAGSRVRTCIRSCGLEGAVETDAAYAQANPALDHAWQDATCTVPKTCDRCGATEGEALEHSWSDWADVAGEEADCENAGCEYRTCSVGGETEYRAKDALGHVWSDWADVEGDEATCTEDGTESRACSRCGETESQTKAALGHDLVHEVATPATCTEAGVAASSSCSRCDYSEGGGTIAALGHNYKNEDGTWNVTSTIQAADCVLPLIEAHTCIRAGCTEETEGHTIQVTGDALGHDYILADGSYDTSKAQKIEATCDTEGYTLYTCTRCEADVEGHTLKTDIVMARNHANKVWKDKLEATCTEDGHEDGYWCPDCEAWVSGGETILAGHTWGAWVETPATCGVAGSRTRTCGAANCGETETDADYAAANPALTHIWEESSTASTCYVAGGKIRTCVTENGCGKTETLETYALREHSIKDTVIAPDCKTGEAGYTLHVCTYDDCDYSVTDTWVPAQHTPGAAATCASAQVCTACGTEIVAALGHDETGADATCTTDQVCGRCGTVLVERFGHDFADEDAVCIDRVCLTCGETVEGNGEHQLDDADATCIDQICALCGETIAKTTEHAYAVVIVEATCTKEGLKTETCALCGDVVETVLAKKAHSCGEWKVDQAPTCQAAGSRSRTCTAEGCGHVETQTLEIVDHAYETTYTAATCGAAGFTTYDCKWCDDAYTVEDEDAPATGEHTDTEEILRESTCTVMGEKQITCTVCSRSYTAEIALKEHAYQSKVTAPTCTAEGYTTYTCSVCGDSYQADETEKKAHQYTDEVIKEATCKESGLRKYTCSVCGNSYAEEIAKLLTHTAVAIEAVTPTCTTDGSKNGQKCAVCDVILVAPVVDPAKGHAYESVVTAPTCTEGGYTTHTCSVCGDTYTDSETEKKGHAYESAVTEPTCTEGGYTTHTCSVCGDTYTDSETEKKGHAYESVVTAPTCTEGGYTTHTCSVCGDTYTDSETEKKGHAYESAVTEPTCTEGGYTTHTCSVCGDTYTDSETEATGHLDDITLEAVEPKCGVSGLTEGKKCSACGQVTKAQTVIAALRHVSATYEYIAPTCTTEGREKSGSYCTLCGVELAAPQMIDALGHDIVVDAAVEATCTATGLTEGQHCSRCDAEKVAQQETPALGHAEVTDAAVDATCTADGLTEGTHCSRCGEVLVAQQTISATGHTPAVLAAVEATCTATGLTEGEQCSVCGTITKAQEIVPATGHVDVTILEAKAATCTATGLTEGQVCACGTILKAQEIIAALGHETATDAAVAPTCTETGLTEGSHCSRCNEVLEAQEVVAATGHTMEVLAAVEATCTETGLTEGAQCTACGTITMEQTTVDALGHEIVTDAAVAPTCTETGLTEGSHCTRCDDATVAQEEVAALGHTEVEDPKVEATCTEDGLTAGSHCAVCDAEIVAQNVITAKGHKTVVDAYVAPTCTETGLTEGSHCSVCDEKLTVQEIIPALEHAYVGTETTAATCTADGLMTYVCANDDTHTYTEVIPALGHDYVDHEAQKETCTEIGWEAYQTCSRCDYTTYAEIAATGHEMDEGTVTVEFTCTTAGEIVYACEHEGCEYTETVEVEAHHTPEVIEAVAPTCTETGLTEGSKCSACGEILLAQTVVEASHTWEDVTIHQEASCEIDGSKDVRCTVEGCDATATVVIPAFGHTEVIDPPKAVTCEEDGLSEGSHCSVCGATITAQTVIPGGHRWSKAPCTTVGAICYRCGESNSVLLEHVMLPATCTEPIRCKYGCGLVEGEALGHTEVVIPAEPAMCGVPGWTSGKECSVCGEVIEAPKVVPALEHQIVQYEAKKPTFTSIGWEAYEACDFCAYTTMVAIPALGVQSTETYEQFIEYLPWLEKWAAEYALANPATDPVALIIKYIRTGVDRYNSGSWGIMAGYEDAGFAKYVNEQEDLVNLQYDNVEDMIKVSGLKNIEYFRLPNGDLTDIGHMFGTMDITYHNKGSVNHADVGGWAGDLVDLLSTADHTDHADVIASAGDDFEALVEVIRNELLGHSFDHSDVFSQTDLYGDLDAFYVMQNLNTADYQAGDMTALFNSYFTTALDDVDRAGYLLENRLNGVATRSAVREAVYTAYTSNNVISTLEGTRDFNASDLSVLRQAVCYAFADYLCELAGDYVDVTENPYLEVFQSTYANLAPGISMEIHYANSADDKQMVYYLAYAAVGREDVTVLANYNERYVTHWEMSRVLDQANSTQALYGDPESEHYIENFNVITAINGAGFNMGTGEPGGLLVMHGEQYHAIDSNGFFGMHKDGYAVIGTTEEYNTIYAGKIEEAIAGFGTMLVKDGEIAITATSDYYESRASRTAVGITATGRVVFMVLDGRQEPWSCGGSMIEIAQIMKNAGCVQAINLDGGGSTTFVARQAGEEELSVVNRPSDGVSRSVATGLVMVSTAPSSTAFDHALVESEYNNLTVGSTVQMTAKGVSATGNVVDMPEGTSWAVSDESMGTIDENGVFTALQLGTVDVQVLLDDTVLGQKTLNVVVPDQLYFTKEKIDGVYGSTLELPLRARYCGKEVAFNAADVVFTLSNDTVGTMEGLTFCVAEESDITNVTITAILAADETVGAKINVVLFKQGENSFDFDNATGGSRILAWQREVSNSTTADDSIYYIVDPEEAMVTSYVIALDMTQIPIPERLDSLIYMLPGADMEGASAWTFLLQLAERISVLTEVKPKITFDPNFDVDYSELKLINDYFVLNEDATVFDEETNTLTLTLNWIDQTAPIPIESANPLCMVSGLKITPKEDAAWNDKDQLKVVNSGDISYTIYMRASGLYSFAQKTENQETFGLYPFVNPNDASEKGGYFKDTYTEFEDTYTLVKTLKNGWYTEENGFRYYVDGVYHVGVMEADGLYYDFGENGINVGKKVYTGLHVMNGNTYYIQAGEIATGWNIIGDDWYLFNYTTGAGLNGKHVSGGITYEFENGRLLSGVWVQDSVGYKYYYGPGNYYAGWKIIDGEEYFFVKGYALTGVVPVQEAHDLIHYWYEFTDTGVKVGYAADGLYWYEGELYYVVDALADRLGLYYIDGYYYNFHYNDYAVRNQTFWVYETNGLDKPEGQYRFDENGRMILTTEIVEEDGLLYYYENGPVIYHKGMVEFEGNLYYIGNSGTAVVNDFCQVYKPNGLVSSTGVYLFDENGHLVAEPTIFEKDGVLYYFNENGKLGKDAGLVCVDGDFYYIQSDGTAVTDTTMYVSKTNNLIAKGTYTFGSDGKMLVPETLTGVFDGYYLLEGVKTEAGLVKYKNNYYYASEGGQVLTDGLHEVTQTNDLLPAGVYEFDEDGKIVMNEGLVEIDGQQYYFEDGRVIENKGLIKIGSDYYYIGEDGTPVTDIRMDVVLTNGLLPEGNYCFGEDGKMFERLAGDATDNDTVDMEDAVLILEYASEGGVKINRINADVNEDGVVDADDALLIMQYASGWDVELK